MLKALLALRTPLQLQVALRVIFESNNDRALFKVTGNDGSVCKHALCQSQVETPSKLASQVRLTCGACDIFYENVCQN